MGRWSLSSLLIDHAASLKSGFDIRMTSNDAFRNGPAVVFRKRTIDHLRMLNGEKLRSMSEFLSEKEIRGIMERRNRILAHVDQLILENGADNVLF